MNEEHERVVLVPPPAVNEIRKCLVCALDKPWGIMDEATGVAVCKDCRDARHRLLAAEVWICHGCGIMNPPKRFFEDATDEWGHGTSAEVQDYCGPVRKRTPSDLWAELKQAQEEIRILRDELDWLEGK